MVRSIEVVIVELADRGVINIHMDNGIVIVGVKTV